MNIERKLQKNYEEMVISFDNGLLWILTSYHNLSHPQVITNKLNIFNMFENPNKCEKNDEIEVILSIIENFYYSNDYEIDIISHYIDTEDLNRKISMVEKSFNPEILDEKREESINLMDKYFDKIYTKFEQKKYEIIQNWDVLKNS
ncbi:hypothetical protein [Helcococcus kunzii]|uniref:hypothetical protein n=1 Tax=Helcococcus kunzii TaxID=40091 RepID=UPI0024ACB7CC|nr:hypothetical protein [Helcococcus kunzii]